MFVFSAATLVLTYLVERLQHLLPLNPQHLPNVEPALALNTAISFTTNTNWQSYTPETTMSYLTQMLGLATHNFWSAAVGMALAIAFVRGIARRETKTLGNFWVDLTRGTLWVLLPISIVYSLALVSQGVVQNFKAYDTVKLVEPQRVTGSDGKTTLVTTQTIAQGPVASQEAIKMLGTNGGGFFNANSAHPFENPTPLTNFLQMLLHLPVARGACNHAGADGRLAQTRVGRARGDGGAMVRRHAHLLLGGVAAQPPAAWRGSACGRSCRPAGNMEGKEVRFGIANSALFATVTTDASCGAVNSMHDSFSPLGGMVPMVNILLGEIVFGGVGAGLYGNARLRRAVGVHRGSHGRPHAGVSRQEDRSLRRADGHAVPAHLSVVDSRLRGRRCAHAQPWPEQPGQSRPAWLVRDSLRLHIGDGATMAPPSQG